MKCESCVYGVNVGGNLHCASPYFPKPKIYEKVDNCKEYEPIKKPITNFDKIRAMSDEELAKKMSGLESFALTCGGAWPPEKWLEWLRREA